MSEPHVIKAKDLFAIVGVAKTNFSDLKLPMEVSDKAVCQSDLACIAMIEALTMYLNKNNLLVRLVKIDYTDSSGNFEETD